MITRILSALFLIPLVLGIIFFAPPTIFAIVVTTLASIAFYEFICMAQNLDPSLRPRTATALALICGFIATYPVTNDHRTIAVLLFFSAMAYGCLVICNKPSDVVPLLVWPAVGFVYIFFFFSFVYDIRFFISPDDTKGALILLTFLGIQWVGDTFAYFTGKAMGRRKLAPSISPKKTIEGTIGGLAGSISVALLLPLWLLPEIPVWSGIVIGFVIGALGQAGDLIESMFKRTSGVKDSSNLIPGHGGLLDRTDSLILTAPVYYGLVSLIQSFGL